MVAYRPPISPVVSRVTAIWQMLCFQTYGECLELVAFSKGCHWKQPTYWWHIHESNSQEQTWVGCSQIYRPPISPVVSRVTAIWQMLCFQTYGECLELVAFSKGCHWKQPTYWWHIHESNSQEQTWVGCSQIYRPPISPVVSRVTAIWQMLCFQTYGECLELVAFSKGCHWKQPTYWWHIHESNSQEQTWVGCSQIYRPPISPVVSRVTAIWQMLCFQTYGECLELVAFSKGCHWKQPMYWLHMDGQSVPENMHVFSQWMQEDVECAWWPIC